MAETQKFKQIAEALNGIGGFADGGALVRFPSETDDQYSRRKEVAWYANDLLPACLRIVGFLSSRPPMRQTENPLLLKFLDDCNWRGDGIDVFWQTFMLEALARGSMFLLIDMPRAIPATQAEQVERRAFPFLTPILPEHAHSWKFDERGALTFFEMNDTLNGKPVVRGWSDSEWWVREGDRRIQFDAHKLGVCPVICYTERGDFPCFGSLSGIADLSRRLYNLRSELDDILRRHAFPVFAAEFPVITPAPGEPPESAQARQVAIINGLVESIGKLGTNRGIVSPGPVSFVAPPDGPANVYMSAIDKLEARINEMAMRIDMSGEKSAESGLALTIRFQALNTALARFAKRMEDAERRALDVACRWLDIAPETITTRWHDDYKIIDTASELEALGMMQSQGFPDRVIREKMRSVVQMEFSGSAPEALEKLIASVDEGGAEVPPAAGGEGSGARK